MSNTTTPQDDTAKLVSNISIPDPTISETATSASDKLTMRNRVQFSNVNLREYEICLGDNPAVQRGAPISLDWNYNETEFCYSIEDFEKSEHCSVTYQPKSTDHMFSFRHSSLERLHLLKKLGYSRRDIKEAMENVQRVRKQRFQTRRQCERNDKIKTIYNSIFCLFCRISPGSICDLEKHLSESMSTVSTRNSIDSLAVDTDVTIVWPRNRLQRIRSSSNITRSNTESSRTLSKTENKMPPTTAIWQEWIIERRQKWQARRQQETLDSLDAARHSGVILDLDNP